MKKILEKTLTRAALPLIALFALARAYADYTVVYQYMEPVVTKEFDRYGGEFDYTFEKVTRTAPTYYSGLGSGFSGIRQADYSYSYSGADSWVKSLRVSGIPVFNRTLNGVSSTSTLPKDSFTVQPQVTAMVEENTTSSDRSCTLTITETKKSYSFNSTTPTTSTFHWYCVFKQAAGSAKVTVTLDANGGVDAQPRKSYSYTNGNTYRQWVASGGSGNWVFPYTSRTGYVFDAWYTVSSAYPEADGVRIDETTKTSARVTKIIAHWLFEAPHNFTASRNLTDKVALAWEPVADLNATYGIYRSEDATCPATPLWSGKAQAFNDTTATPGVAYNYWVKATGTDNGLEVVSVAGEPVIGMREMEQVAAPTITSADGALFYGASALVTLACATDGAAIHYTTDGTDPDAASPLYGGSFAITDTTTVKAVAYKDGMRASGVVAATITKVLPLALNDALDTELAITTGGAGEWTGVRDAAAKSGAGYARSGAVGNRQSAWLSVTVNGKGTFSFWWRVSCEADEYGDYECDAAVFTAPGADVAELKRDGVMADWERVEATFAEAGEHTLTWTYRKDKNGADGDDSLYLDGFLWTPAAPDPVVWTVTFDLNGAEAQGAESSKSVADETAIGALPTPTRDGYTFAGWWTARENGMEATATMVATSDITLYAHWTENPPPAPTYTETTPVPVRHDWLEKYRPILSAAGGDYEAAAMRETGKRDGKGKALQVWHDYVAGTDPTNANSRFAAKVAFRDGKPVVSWEPDLNENGAKTERFYKVFGKKTLAANENWTRLAGGDATDGYSFFKVSVGMEDTPDTEDDLKFGDDTGTDGGSGGGEDARPVTLESFYSAGAAGQDGGIRVAWYTNIDTDSESATGIVFFVYRARTQSIQDAAQVAMVPATRFNRSYEYEDTLDDYETYYYWVRAETETARSEYSPCVSAAAKVPGPRNLLATTTRQDGVLLTWDGVTGATAYRIYADDNDTVNGWIFSRDVGETTDTSYFDADAPVGVKVVYKVVTVAQAADEYACSTVYGAVWSGEHTPPSLRLSQGSRSLYVYVTEVAGATGYEIYRSDTNDPAGAQKIGEGAWFWDSSVVGGRVYYYWARAVYEDGASNFSEAASGGATLASPENVNASWDRTDGIEVTWNAVDGAEAYKVYRMRLNTDDDYIALGTTTSTRWLDTTVSPGEASIYKVSAIAATGESGTSRPTGGQRAE